MPRTKPFLLAGVVLTVAGLVATLSVYKVAVLNAYLRFAQNPELQTAVEQRPYAALANGTLMQRGEHLVQVMGCKDCHGPKLAGQSLSQGLPQLVLSAPNLTVASDGERTARSAQALRRALRLGIDAEYRALWAMPRAALLRLCDDDVDALVAYVMALTPQHNALPQSRLHWRGYLGVAARTLALVDRTPLAAPLANSTWPAHAPGEQDADFGPYLAAIGHCNSCHVPANDDRLRPGHKKAPLLHGAAICHDAATWAQKLREGRCPDGLDTATRGTPSRMQALGTAETEALRRNFAANAAYVPGAF